MIESYNIYLIIVVASVVGSLVRIVFEWEKKALTIQRAVFILIASLVVSYLFYLANDHQRWIAEKYIGFPSLISGIIAMEVVKFFIEDLPAILKTALRNKVNASDDGSGDV